MRTKLATNAPWHAARIASAIVRTPSDGAARWTPTAALIVSGSDHHGESVLDGTPDTRSKALQMPAPVKPLPGHTKRLAQAEA